MKKFTVLLIFVIIALCSIQAQMKVKSTGKVKIGSDPNGSIPDDPQNRVTMQIYGSNGPNKGGSRIAFGDYGSGANQGANVFLGEYGDGDSDALELHGKYGIYFTLGGNDNQYSYMWLRPEGLYVCGVYYPSDERFKKDIKKISSPLDKLQKLNGVTYKYISGVNLNNPKLNNVSKVLSSNDTTIVGNNKYKKKSSQENVEDTTTHMGFTAQNVLEAFPSLVKKNDSSSYYYVDYVGLIPVIVESLKELKMQVNANTKLSDELAKTNAKLAELEKRLNSCCGTTKQKSAISESSQNIDATNNVLYANVPNPFSEKTEIKYTIADDVIKAMLNVYDLQGYQIKSFPILTKGSGSITINGSELRPGLYTYSLILNNQEIDTKRMILTQ